MVKGKPVYLPQNYGHIYFKLKELLDARGMTRNCLSRLVNTRFSVIDHLYQGNTERMDCDVLARICFALQCSLSDIVEYEKIDKKP